MPVNATTGYNITQISQADGIVGTLQAINLYCDGWFGVLLLLIIFFIMIISFYYVAGMRNSLIGSTMILFIMALLFWSISLISAQVFWIIFVMTIIMFIVGLKGTIY